MTDTSQETVARMLEGLYEEAKHAVKHRDSTTTFSRGWNECRVMMLKFLAEKVKS